MNARIASYVRLMLKKWLSTSSLIALLLFAVGLLHVLGRKCRPREDLHCQAVFCPALLHEGYYDWSLVPVEREKQSHFQQQTP